MWGAPRWNSGQLWSHRESQVLSDRVLHQPGFSHWALVFWQITPVLQSLFAPGICSMSCNHGKTFSPLENQTLWTDRPFSKNFGGSSTRKKYQMPTENMAHSLGPASASRKIKAPWDKGFWVMKIFFDFVSCLYLENYAFLAKIRPKMAKKTAQKKRCCGSPPGGVHNQQDKSTSQNPPCLLMG